MTANPLPRQHQAGSENCLDIGTRVAEFEITGIVGEGGFGIVYLAFDHSLRRTIALKEYMPPALAGRGAEHNVAVRSKRHQETFDAGLKSFINEARLLAQFDHPALIKVYRFWEQNNTAYMAMRYYEGRTLKEIISDEPALATEAWWKAGLKPILEALEVLYHVQILHRDISPENIMIQPTGEPVLLDFGAARQLIQNSTQALTIILKPGYAPIEQYADDPSMKQGPWTDIYALSAVVYSTIAKKAPPASVARMIKDPMEPLIPEDYPGYSRQFLFAISKGLAVKPDDRPQTIAEFRRLLGLDKSGSRASSANVVADGRKSAEKSKRLEAASEKSSRQPADVRTSAVAPSTRRGWRNCAAGIACVAALALYSFMGSKPVSPASPPTAVTEPRIELAASANSAETGAQPAAATAASSPPAAPARQTSSPVTGKTDQTPNTSNSTAARATAPDTRKTAAGRQPSDAAKETGTIQFQVKPWGSILVDGVSKGASPPLKNLVLPEGKHQIRVVNPNYRDHVLDVEITGRKAVVIDHDFSRSKK